MSVEQTINTFRVAGEMFLVGKKFGESHLHDYPFIPDFDDLAHHLYQTVSMGALTQQQREFLVLKNLPKVYAIMEKRAYLQTKYADRPQQMKKEVVQAFRFVTQNELELDPDKVEVIWGLFSFGILVPEPEYKKVERYLGSTQSTGVIAGNLGNVYVVLRNKDWKLTHIHEDIHFLHQHIDGYLSNSDRTSENLCVRRAKENLSLPDDLEACKTYFERSLELIRDEVRLELPAHLWSRDLTTRLNGDSLSLAALLNAIYCIRTNLSPSEQIREHFEAIMKIVRIETHYKILIEIVKQGMKDYKGKFNRWDWAAATATVMPPNASINLFKAVFLGRRTILRSTPKIEIAEPLAATLITHARKLLSPRSYGPGEIVYAEYFADFLEIVKLVWENQSLYDTIVAEYAFDDNKLKILKEQFIQYAWKSFVPSQRGKAKKWLAQNL